MEDAAGYRCECGYEFLSKAQNPICPKCKNASVQSLDVNSLTGFDD